MHVGISKQSPNIAGGVHPGKNDLDEGGGAGLRHARDETEDAPPLKHVMATHLEEEIEQRTQK